MAIINEAIKFKILTDDIELFSSETAYGWKTVAEVNGKYHYLGDELISIETAINLWQDLNDRPLTSAEFQSVMDNIV